MDRPESRCHRLSFITTVQADCVRSDGERLVVHGRCHGPSRHFCLWIRAFSLQRHRVHLVYLIPLQYPALWMSGCILPTIIACVPCLIVLRITNPPPKQGLQLQCRPYSTSNFEVDSRIHISVARQTSNDCPKPPGLEVQDSVFRPWSTKSDVGDTVGS